MSTKHLIISNPSTILVTTTTNNGSHDVENQFKVHDLSVKAWDDGIDPLVQIMAEHESVDVQIDLTIEDAKTIREWLDKAIFDAVKIENKIEDEKRKAAKKEGGIK